MTVIANAGLVLKDSKGNEGIVKSFTDKDITKISNAITDVGQVVDPVTHMPIEATKTSAGVVQLATAQDITNGTAGKVVDAQELNNFAQTLPSVNGVTDVSSGDNSNQIVVSKFGGNKTLTIDNVKHATQADTAGSVAWNKVSGKPSTYTPSSHTHDDRYYTESEIDTKLGGKANTSGALFTVNGLGSPGWSAIGTGTGGSCIQVKTTDNTYPSICFHRSGYSHCVLAESGGQLGTMHEGDGTFNHLITSANIGSQSVNYANSAGSAENSNYTYWLRTSSHHDHIVHTEWDGGYFWTYVTAGDGGYRAVRVERSNSSGWADSAGSVAWGNVSGKPSTYTPSSHTHDDRYYTESEINTKLSALLLQIYPVGSIYISANSTNPGTLFGGTWKALDQGRVLIGANSTYKAGATGGEFTHTITTSEMPSHTHTGTTGNESAGHTHSGTTGNQSAGHTHSWSGTTSSDGSHGHTASSNSTGAHQHNSGHGWHTLDNSGSGKIHCLSDSYIDSDAYSGNITSANGSHSHTITVNSNGAHTHTVSGTTGGISANHTHSFTTGGISAHHTHSFTTGASGSGSAMNNMQPYLAVYMWQRTA